VPMPRWTGKFPIWLELSAMRNNQFFIKVLAPPNQEWFIPH